MAGVMGTTPLGSGEETQPGSDRIKLEPTAIPAGSLYKRLIDSGLTFWEMVWVVHIMREYGATKWRVV